ncbi:MAG: exodeoxyribonuclease VII large subunit [Aquiluna sp.]|nr:exodeoxyribonuclease VII large subunit [Aquiluna sp.]MCF8545361.1 exodeoxyribonuclease VII large subunit [Aquiluna sp.]
MQQSTSMDSQSKVSSENSPWQVSALSKSVKDWIERLGRVWIEGELQSYNPKPAGIFASLRDLDVEMAIEVHAFANSGAEIADGLKQGDRVVALVQPQFWPKNGKLSFRLLSMHKVGLGELLERIEKLKQQLISEGLAAIERKKPLPFLPNKIGLITGANSDAEKDVLQNAKLRWPDVQFEVIHTHVQGDKAVGEILFALDQLDAMAEVDLIIIARGGGSFQDLLPFSDERLVRAAANLSKPFISAIGHENDAPLLDLVADLRASTPTDAAKRAVPDVVEERRNLDIALQRIRYRIGSFLDAQQQLIAGIISRPVLESPYGFIDGQDELLGQLKKRIGEIFSFRIEQASSHVQQLHARAKSLSPLLTLERGYSVITDVNGKPVEQLTSGQSFQIRTSKQEISAKAESTRSLDA